ncbi:MAG: amidohydrolase [Roseiflexaceae bacterium]|nr:amidohydrolase [Roseiflexaceae bacterium]
MTTVFYNGPIYTLDPALPKAQAIAIRDGRVVAIGTEGRVTAAVGSRAEGINLRGRAVIPALTDAHVHLLAHALRRREVNLNGVGEYEQALVQVERAAAALPAGEWLRGGGWDHVRWAGRWPNAADLDAVTPGRPAVLFRKDGHCAWLNGPALAIAGVDADTPDPVGGSIRRDTTGQPTGLLFENAIEMIGQHFPATTEEDQLAAVRDAIREAHSYGMAGMHIPPSMEPGAGALALRTVQTLRARGQLKLRSLIHLDYGTLDEAIALGLHSGLGDGWVRLGGVKIFADGTLGSETAELLRPYEGSRNLGLPTIATEELNAAVRKANAHGLAVIIHAIGDGANRRVLDAIEGSGVRGQGSGDPLLNPEPRPLIPNRIEHCQLLDLADLPRFAQLGVVASMQPSHCTSDIELADRLWGEERNATAYAWKALLESGATLAFGSDAPVEPLNPWLGIHAAVTRQRPNGLPAGGWHPAQRLSVGEALRAFTSGAAACSGMTGQLGMLALGTLADLAVLSADPFTTPAAALHSITAEMTVLEGTIVWER